MTREDMERGLASEDPEERRQATARLASVDAGLHVELLLLALGDADWRVRKEAISVARGAAPASRVLQGLMQAIGPGQNVGLRNAAVEALSAFGADAVDAIAVALPNLDADSKKLATEALASCEHPTALLILHGLTRDADPNVRATAIEGVASIGACLPDTASAILIANLAAESAFERLAALDGLNQLGAVLPWGQIEKLLQDPVLERPALLAAGRCRDPLAAGPLISALRNARGATFEAALMGLCELGRSGGTCETAVSHSLGTAQLPLKRKLVEVASPKNDDPVTRRMATLLLGSVGTREAAHAAIVALADDAVMAEAEEALLSMGPASTDAAVAGLQDADPEQRARCAQLLGRLFPKEAPRAVVRAVSALLFDSDSHVVRAALETLAQFGDDGALSKIAELLISARGAVRWSAETALAEIASRHPDSVQPLLDRATPQGADAVAAAVVLGALAGARAWTAKDEEFLTGVLAHESRFARRAALDALASGTSTRAVDAVAFALTDENRDVQLAAVRTLGRMKNAAGEAIGLAHLLPLVEQAADDDLLAHAVAALGDTGKAEAVRSLRPLTGSAPAHVAVSAIESIARIPKIHHVDELIDGLSHPNPEVVKAVLGVFAELHDPRVVPHVGACLDHEAWDVRRLAADLLGQQGSEANVELLRARMPVEKEPLVKDAITRALEALGALRRTPTPAGSGSPVPK